MLSRLPLNKSLFLRHSIMIGSYKRDLLYSKYDLARYLLFVAVCYLLLNYPLINQHKLLYRFVKVKVRLNLESLYVGNGVMLM